MIDFAALRRPTLVGTALQIAMVVAGHFSTFIAMHVFLFGGIVISAIAGFLYGRAAANFGAAALGGAIAGGVCALIGIAVSVVLGDTAPMILAIGTLSSAVAGALGGLNGRMIPRTAN